METGKQRSSPRKNRTIYVYARQLPKNFVRLRARILEILNER